MRKESLNRKTSTKAGARPVAVRELIRDIHGTAVLHEQVARHLEQQGERQAAFENFVIAAEYFDQASREFETAAKKQKLRRSY